MSKSCWKLIDINCKMSKETQMSMQMLPVYWIVLVKCCRCSHNLYWLQKLCPNLRASPQNSVCECLSFTWQHAAVIYAHWHNDSALFCHSFSVFFALCSYPPTRRFFFLAHKFSTHICMFFCLFFRMCDAFNRLRDAANRSQSCFQ